MIGLFSGDSTSNGTKTRSFQRADIAIEKKRMLAAIEVMQRMFIEELTEVGFLADHMLTRGDKDSTRTKHAKHLATCSIEIAGMMQHGSRKYDVERAIGKRQTFGKFLDHLIGSSASAASARIAPAPTMALGSGSSAVTANPSRASA